MNQPTYGQMAEDMAWGAEMIENPEPDRAQVKALISIALSLSVIAKFMEMRNA
jgi:hypothetical protein